MKSRILIVEDQFIEANNLQMILERAGYLVCPIAHSVQSALEIIALEKPDMVLLDIYLKGNLTGIDLAKILRKENIAFVYLSANSTKDILEAAKSTHPYGFLVKPFREKDVLVTLDVAHYLHLNRREPELFYTAKEDIDAKNHNNNEPIRDPHFGSIVGESPALLHVLNHIKIVSPSETSVLVLGESGTGKEKVAEAIHNLSLRKNRPLIKVNCAALPPSLIESELFGHEKGSFTGAFEKRIGKFEQAHGGTVFLDEIGEMPLDMQVKLLNVLQEKKIERIGGRTTLPVNVRIIAATNRNLEKEVGEGRFRIDLYYRLNVFPIELPALRARKVDIPLLLNHFTQFYSGKFNKKVNGFSDKITTNLLNYHWPGNIRELQHFVERHVLLAQGPIINEVHFPEISAKEQKEHTSGGKMKSMDETERDYIMEVMRKCNGKISGKDGAAEILGMNVSTLNSRIKRLGIEKDVIFKA
jgi:two-component system response regulator HydG